MKHLNCRHCGSEVELFGDVDSISSVECEACEQHICSCGATEHVSQVESHYQKIICKPCGRLLVIDATITSHLGS